MESISKVTYGVVSLVVIVLVIAVAVIPVIENAQSIQTTKENNVGARYTAQLDVSDIDFTLTVTDVANKAYTINGKETDLKTTSLARIVSDQFQMNLTAVTPQIVGNGFGDVIDIVDGDSLSITDGAFTYTPGLTSSLSDPVTGEVAMLFAYDPNGTWGEYGSQTPFVDKGTVIYGIENGNTSTVPTIIFSYDHATNTTTSIGAFFSSSAEVTKEYSVTFTGTTDDSGQYAYQILTQNSTAVYDGNESTNRSTQVFAPIKYTVEDTSSPIYMMLGIIPLMMFIVPVMVCVGLITNRRD